MPGLFDGAIPRTTDIAVNPGLKNREAIRHNVDKMQGKKVALNTVRDVSGYVPSDLRKAGNVQPYSGAGRFFLILSGLGAVAANTQAKGSQKNTKGKGTFWQRAATTQKDATLKPKYLNKAKAPSTGWRRTWKTLSWINPFTSLARVVTGPIHFFRKRSAFKANFQQEYGRAVPKNMMAKTSTRGLLTRAKHGDLATMKEAKKDRALIMKFKLMDAKGKGDNVKDVEVKGLTVEDVRRSTPAVRAAWASYAEKKMVTENVHFMDWAEHAMKPFFGAHTPDESTAAREMVTQRRVQRGNGGVMRKIDFAMGYENFVKNGSDSQVNVEYTRRRDFKKLYDNTGLRKFYDTYNQKKQQLVDKGQALANNSLFSFKSKSNLREEIRVLRNEIAEMENEGMSPGDADQAGQLVKDAYKDISIIMVGLTDKFDNELRDLEV